MRTIVNVKRLEHLLQAHWAEFLDTTQVIRCILEYVRDTEFNTIKQEQLLPQQVRVTVSKFTLSAHPEEHFEICVDYTAPKGRGVVIGTNIYVLNLSGDFFLKDSFGTHFLPKSA